MFSKSIIVINTIGQESLYVLEKSRNAIYQNESNVDIDFAKRLLETYKSKLANLKKEIDSSNLYDNSNFDYEFEVMFHAINKLHAVLGNIDSREKELEALIFQSLISTQDDEIRKRIEAAEQ